MEVVGSFLVFEVSDGFRRLFGTEKCCTLSPLQITQVETEGLGGRRRGEQELFGFRILARSFQGSQTRPLASTGTPTPQSHLHCPGASESSKSKALQPKKATKVS